MPTPSGGPTSSPYVSIGICGQGPSDHPDLAEWLLRQGIESMSLNPDTVVDTWLQLSKLPRVP
jgi:pyruvate, water dikinase